MIFLCDEGSQGYSLFWYLLAQQFRIIFVRGPPHKFSNVFNNAMRAVPKAFRAALGCNILHKFRRAPFGSGRFLRECRETLKLLRPVAHKHPLMLQCISGIARDTNIPLDDLLFDKHTIQSLIDSFCTSGLGKRVETRRWFTLFDSNVSLNYYWTLLLVAILAQFLRAGTDPFSLDCVKASNEKSSNPNKTEEDNEFCFKHACITILLNGFTGMVLRSQLVIFCRLRAHRGHLIACQSTPGVALQIPVMWSTPKDRAHRPNFASFGFNLPPLVWVAAGDWGITQTN